MIFWKKTKWNDREPKEQFLIRKIREERRDLPDVFVT